MANRLSVIATRTGDDGTTGLGDGSRRPKHAPRLAALGDVDELNAMLGTLRAENVPAHIDADLTAIQHDLFDLGAELCIPGHCTILPEHVARLDDMLARYNAALPPLQEFVLPGGTRSAALAHVGRTVCRRAERTVITLSHTEPVSALARQYVNRLSDVLFVIARSLNVAAGQSDVYWHSPQSRTIEK